MKKISKAKAILIRLDKSGTLELPLKKSEIRRANKKLKDVADLIGFNVQIE